MPPGRRQRLPALGGILQAWPWVLLLLALLAVRLSKGAGFVDAYALLSRPFWPGSAQGEWLRSAEILNSQTRLSQLELDNRRPLALKNILRSFGINAWPNSEQASLLSPAKTSRQLRRCRRSLN